MEWQLSKLKCCQGPVWLSSGDAEPLVGPISWGIRTLEVLGCFVPPTGTARSLRCTNSHILGGMQRIPDTCNFLMVIYKRPIKLRVSINILAL